MSNVRLGVQHQERAVVEMHEGLRMGGRRLSQAAHAGLGGTRIGQGQGGGHTPVQWTSRGRKVRKRRAAAFLTLTRSWE
jgi:hypothetical protein